MQGMPDDCDCIWPVGKVPALTMISRLNRMGYPGINRYFTVAIFSLPTIGGSAVSFLYNGGALWALLDVMRGRTPLSREPHMLATAAALYLYCLAMGLSALVNGDFVASLPKLAGLVSLLLFPFAYSNWRRSDKEEIMGACLAGCAIASYGGLAFALVQAYAFAMPRPEGAAGNPLVFANVIAVAGGVALSGVFRRRGWLQLFFLGAFLASALAVSYSASRGPFLLVVAFAILVTATHARGNRLQASVLGILAALAILGLFVTSGITILESRMTVMFRELSMLVGQDNFSTSTGQRVALWQIGTALWLEKPVFGHGAADLPLLINRHLQDEFGITLHFTHFHNVFLTTLVEGGVLGLAALLAMIAIPVVIALRVLAQATLEVERFGATLLLIFFSMFLTSGMVNTVLRHDIMDAVFMAFLAVGLYLSAGTSLPEKPDAPPAADPS